MSSSPVHSLENEQPPVWRGEFAPEIQSQREASELAIKKLGYANGRLYDGAAERGDSVEWLDRLTAKHPTLNHDEARDAYLSGVSLHRVESLVDKVDRNQAIVETWSTVPTALQPPDAYLALGRLQTAKAEVTQLAGSVESVREQLNEVRTPQNELRAVSQTIENQIGNQDIPFARTASVKVGEIADTQDREFGLRSYRRAGSTRPPRRLPRSILVSCRNYGGAMTSSGASRTTSGRKDRL
jgi:hypothetical protein